MLAMEKYVVSYWINNRLETKDIWAFSKQVALNKFFANTMYDEFISID